jgi:hypothetical protein
VLVPTGRCGFGARLHRARRLSTGRWCAVGRAHPRGAQPHCRPAVVPMNSLHRTWFYATNVLLGRLARADLIPFCNGPSQRRHTCQNVSSTAGKDRFEPHGHKSLRPNFSISSTSTWTMRSPRLTWRSLRVPLTPFAHGLKSSIGCRRHLPSPASLSRGMPERTGWRSSASTDFHAGIVGSVARDWLARGHGRRRSPLGHEKVGAGDEPGQNLDAPHDVAATGTPPRGYHSDRF